MTSLEQLKKEKLDSLWERHHHLKSLNRVGYSNLFAEFGVIIDETWNAAIEEAEKTMRAGKIAEINVENELWVRIDNALLENPSGSILLLDGGKFSALKDLKDKN